jgi:2-keto-4-pentenoate hydratase
VYGPGNVIQAGGIILTGSVVESVVSCEYGTQDHIDLYGYLTTT